MTEQPMFTPEDMDRHRCSYGCGRPFQFSITNIEDGTTEHLCLADLAVLAASIMEAALVSGVIDTSTMTAGNGQVEPLAPWADPVILNAERAAAGEFDNDGLDSADAYYTEEV